MFYFIIFAAVVTKLLNQLDKNDNLINNPER